MKMGISHANVLLDQRNAFGSLEWQTLDKALERLMKNNDTPVASNGSSGLLRKSMHETENYNFDHDKELSWATGW